MDARVDALEDRIAQLRKQYDQAIKERDYENMRRRDANRELTRKYTALLAKHALLVEELESRRADPETSGYESGGTLKCAEATDAAKAMEVEG